MTRTSQIIPTTALEQITYKTNGKSTTMFTWTSIRTIKVQVANANNKKKQKIVSLKQLNETTQYPPQTSTFWKFEIRYSRPTTRENEQLHLFMV